MLLTNKNNKKNKMNELIKAALTALLTFLAPIKFAIIIIGLLVVTDLILGLVTRPIKKQKLDENKLFRPSFKILIYSLLMIIALTIDVYLKTSIAHLTVMGISYIISKFVFVLISFKELVSIDNHIKLVNHDKGFKYYFDETISSIKYIKEQISKILTKKIK